jgi:hypothetical protein
MLEDELEGFLKRGAIEEVLEAGRKWGDIDDLAACLVDFSRSVGDCGEVGLWVTVAPGSISDDGEAAFESLAEGIPEVHRATVLVLRRLGWGILGDLRGERTIADLDQVGEDADRLQLDGLEIVGEGGGLVRVLVISRSEPHT